MGEWKGVETGVEGERVKIGGKGWKGEGGWERDYGKEEVGSRVTCKVELGNWERALQG